MHFYNIIIYICETTFSRELSHIYIYMEQCPAESLFWLVFQVFKFSLNTYELMSNGPYASQIGLSLTKLLGAEFKISHTFQCERYFSFACSGYFEKVP